MPDPLYSPGQPENARLTPPQLIDLSESALVSLLSSGGAANVRLSRQAVSALSERQREILLPPEAYELLFEKWRQWSGGDPSSFAIAVGNGARSVLLDHDFWRRLGKTCFLRWGRMTQQNLIEVFVAT